MEIYSICTSGMMVNLYVVSWHIKVWNVYNLVIVLLYQYVFQCCSYKLL